MILDTSGKVTDYFEKRDHIQMTVKRYKMPDIGAKTIKIGVVAIHIPEQGWQIKKVQN